MSSDERGIPHVHILVNNLDLLFLLVVGMLKVPYHHSHHWARSPAITPHPVAPLIPSNTVLLPSSHQQLPLLQSNYTTTNSAAENTNLKIVTLAPVYILHLLCTILSLSKPGRFFVPQVQLSRSKLPLLRWK